MDDRGEVKCIKFSLENKILAVQRTSKTVVRHSLEQHRIENRCLEETGSEFWLFACPRKASGVGLPRAFAVYIHDMKG